MLKCLIIDDERSCIGTLQLMLQKKFSEQVQVAATTSRPHDAAKLITLHSPDLVFLDVEMPKMSGVDLLQSLGKINFQVIFTTAHQQYALQAIKLNALDYLLKPISLDDLSEAINRCLDRKGSHGSDLINAFLQQIKPGSSTVKRIAIAGSDTTQFVPISEIVRIESQSNYSTVFFTARQKIIVAKTLKEYEEQLIPFNFLRVHHSHLINMEHVIGYKNEDGGYIVMRGNDIIEISRRKKQEVLQRLHSM